jgi:hypothetical protein
VRTTEVPLFDENDLAGRLTDMRVWLDQHGYEPSTFTYFFLDHGMKIRVTFNIDREAEAFVQEFGGSLLDTPWATGHLTTAQPLPARHSPFLTPNRYDLPQRQG